MSQFAKFLFLTLAGSAISTCAFAQQVKSQGATTQFVAPDQATQAAPVGIDFGNARAMPLPSAALAPPPSADSLLQAPNLPQTTPGHAAGGGGDGRQAPVQLVPPVNLNQQNEVAAAQDGVAPQESGTSGQPFTTNRVNAQGDNTQSFYAFRPTGKLFFNINGSTFVCSASMVKPGVVVTAAHCVADFGRSQYYSNWVYVPAYNNGSAPYGVWTVSVATVLTSYYTGTDPCTLSGVVCQDDVAVLTLRPQSGTYAGKRTGWYGYGWDGYGFNSSKQVLISQLGFPVSLDGGNLMQRNDSQGYTASTFSNNTIIGSLMTGGSSGGPWLVNLGVAPILKDTAFGQAATRNIVVGVTSWGYTAETAIKQQGASPFTSHNIVPLVNSACSATPKAC
ncbi:trypsin [Paraburkholderia sp. RAU2J]|uniref:trypsin-like serine peptidase n=1 Tax=Paraburkholderia sp. RAU2J TaxID=1938810 RepID=UPI000F1E2286|nr:trypsin-like serine protease [Paraburkholderia sp. RAU2J]RKT22701.1 trypsin [Paraburkholderia sp. RAU2J]